MEMALVPRRFPKYAAGLNIAGTPRAENTTGALPSNVARKRGGIVRAVSKSCHFAEWALLRFVKAVTSESVYAMEFLNSRRRILPDAVLGMASTKWTARGCL